MEGKVFLIGFVMIAVIIGSLVAKEADIHSVSEFLEGWSEALESGDLDRIMECYDESEMTVVIVSDGIEFDGSAEIRELYESLYERHDVTYVELENVVSRISGDIAWVKCIFKAGMHQKSIDSSWELEVRTTLVLSNINGVWRIVQEHSSRIPVEHR